MRHCSSTALISTIPNYPLRSPKRLSLLTPILPNTNAGFTLDLI